MMWNGENEGISFLFLFRIVTRLNNRSRKLNHELLPFANQMVAPREVDTPWANAPQHGVCGLHLEKPSTRNVMVKKEVQENPPPQRGGKCCCRGDVQRGGVKEFLERLLRDAVEKRIFRAKNLCCTAKCRPYIALHDL
jgi:hypothetical protein